MDCCFPHVARKEYSTSQGEQPEETVITDDVESIFWHDVSVQKSPLRENVPPEYSGVGFTHLQHSRIFGKLGFVMIN